MYILRFSLKSINVYYLYLNYYVLNYAKLTKQIWMKF